MLLRSLRSLVIVGAVALPMIGTGCAREVAHSESDTPRLLGGNTHKETTVYKNADGSTSVQRETQKTP